MDSYYKYLLFFVTVSCTQCHIFPFENRESSPTMILGLENGQILRCQFNDTNNCTELKYEDDTAISSIAISGEFVYFGSDVLLQRCNLNNENKNRSCVEFHNVTSEIYALSISGKYVYVGLVEGVILQCGLRKSQDCFEFLTTNSTVHSIATTDDNIYVGLDNEIMLCSLDDPENCTNLYNISSDVNGLLISRNKVYASLRDGEVWNCDLDITNCDILYKVESEIEAIDIFDEYLHVILDSGDVKRFNLEKNDSSLTVMSRNDSRILSMVSIYGTAKLRKSFFGENKRCVWQSSRRCPPYVNYYSIEDRVPLELHFKNNTVYSSEGNIIFDTSTAGMHSFVTGTAIFTMDPTGRIYASNEQVIFLLHHSSLLAGNPVAAAGEIKIVEGEIKSINTCSGHYWPSKNLTKQIEKALLNKGYEKNVTVRHCFDAEVVKDMNANVLRLFDLYYLKDYLKEFDHRDLLNIN